MDIAPGRLRADNRRVGTVVRLMVGNLRRLRDAHFRSQAEMAERLNISQPRVSQLLNERRGWAWLRDLEEVLARADIDPLELIRPAPGAGFDPVDREIIDLLPRAPSRFKLIVLETLRAGIAAAEAQSEGGPNDESDPLPQTSRRP